MKHAWLIWLFLCVASCASAVERVVCHVDYGGEVRPLAVTATDNPYTVSTTQVGSYFLFRIVFQQQPTDQAAIKTYVYADRDSGPTPIHQATFSYPPTATGRHGFSGLHAVYEPMRDGELQYWCEFKP